MTLKKKLNHLIFYVALFLGATFFSSPLSYGDLSPDEARFKINEMRKLGLISEKEKEEMLINVHLTIGRLDHPPRVQKSSRSKSRAPASTQPRPYSNY